jgi:ABC-type lipoprotein release transport system permease subunit
MVMQSSIYPGRDYLRAANGIVNQYMWLQAIGRLRPQITMAQANATINVVFKRCITAQRGDVLRQVLRETGSLVLIGILAGVPLAIGGTYLIRSMLFGVGWTDPVVLVLASGMLAFLAALAGFVPALRATRVDPLVALRYE